MVATRRNKVMAKTPSPKKVVKSKRTPTPPTRDSINSSSDSDEAPEEVSVKGGEKREQDTQNSVKKQRKQDKIKTNKQKNIESTAVAQQSKSSQDATATARAAALQEGSESSDDEAPEEVSTKTSKRKVEEAEKSVRSQLKQERLDKKKKNIEKSKAKNMTGRKLLSDNFLDALGSSEDEEANQEKNCVPVLDQEEEDEEQEDFSESDTELGRMISEMNNNKTKHIKFDSDDEDTNPNPPSLNNKDYNGGFKVVVDSETLGNDKHSGGHVDQISAINFRNQMFNRGTVKRGFSDKLAVSSGKAARMFNRRR